MADNNDSDFGRRSFIKQAGLVGIAPLVTATIGFGCDDGDECEASEPCNGAEPDCGASGSGGNAGSGGAPPAEAGAETGPVDAGEGGVLDPSDLWNDEGYFVQQTVDATGFEQGIIKARIDGSWREYPNRSVSDGFIEWNLSARLAVVNDPMGMQCLDGPHSGALATYGGRGRGDSAFSLNNAFKGFGLCPKADRIDAAIETVTSTWDAGMMDKLEILKQFYSDPDMWDRRILDSLELYSVPGFMTHSFLNQMDNPIATIVFLAIPGSYEVRAISRLIHPEDPDIPAEDFKKVRWVNMIHDYFHGGPYPDKPRKIAAIYYVVEEYDNTPQSMGIQTVPGQG